MPLSYTTLYTGLSNLLNSEVPGYKGNPQDVFEAADWWGELAEEYSLGITYPSTKVAQAKSKFISEFSQISPVSMNGLTQLPKSFQEFSIVFASGITLGPAIPPPAPPIIYPSTILIQAGESIDKVCSVLALEIHVWFKTGIVNINNVPNPWN